MLFKGKVTKHDKEVVSTTNCVRLADMYKELNHYEWPTELLNPEPDSHVSGGRRGAIMEHIESTIGREIISRRHNKDTMTEEEFYDFYAGNHKGNTAALSRYYDKLSERYGLNKGEK